jgi:hypothetical protein
MAIEKNLKKEFSFLENIKDVLAVLLFGSHAKNEATVRSDIDLCIVAPAADKDSLLSFILQSVNSSRYHIWLFEELPLYMKKEVIDNHKVILCRDKLNLYEYFYFVNKLWKDQEHRQRVTLKDLKEILNKRSSTA